ncbi:hypothetical protein ACMX2H_01145 [Arthrobacter sulfonylureivorans]|uniref:hypothetical protein n=1 Tax=Arthrobacter sulfonylureivorans TaxID=2486855 RepID=UPI0039E58C40
MTHAAHEDHKTGITALLSASYHFMMGRIIDDLAAAGHSDLSKTQLHLLSRIDGDGMTVGDLATRVQIPLQIVNNLVQMMTENDYLATERVGDDIQATSVQVADRGHAARRIIIESQQAVERDWATALGEESYESLRGRLRDLFDSTTHRQPAKTHK